MFVVYDVDGDFCDLFGLCIGSGKGVIEIVEYLMCLGCEIIVVY